MKKMFKAGIPLEFFALFPVIALVNCNLFEDLLISVDGLKSSIETIRLQVESNTKKNNLILENLNDLKEEVKGIQKVEENLNESFNNLKEEVKSVLRNNQDNAKYISQKFTFAQESIASMMENVQTSNCSEQINELENHILKQNSCIILMKEEFYKIDSKMTQESMENNVSC